MQDGNWAGEDAAPAAEALMVALAEVPPGAFLHAHPLVLSLAFVASPLMAARNMARFLCAVPDRAEELRRIGENTEHRHLLCSLFSFSQLLADAVIADPSRLGWVMDESLQREKTRGVFDQALCEHAPNAEGDALLPALHDFKDREMLRIGLRDLQELADEAEICRELSALAESIIQAVERDAWREQTTRHGLPIDDQGGPVSFSIHALGKLGSRELNFSSDVDIVFGHSADGATAGVPDAEGRPVRRLSTRDFFERLARRICERIAAPIAGKPLYRVDTRLRPDGKAGPLSRSVVSYTSYFETQGRVFEQVAYLRARFIAGDAALGQRLDAIFQHFAFNQARRTNLAAEIADLKRRIDFESLDGDSRELDIKRGRGGIREIEFIISLHQLAHGTDDPRLRSLGTMRALDRLSEYGYVDPGAAARLRTAYYFFRRIEHTLQMMHGEQTHLLPSAAEERASLALRCGWADAAEFERLLAERRDTVHAMFREVFGLDESGAASMSLLDALRLDQPVPAEWLPKLEEAGLSGGAGLDALRGLAKSRGFSGSQRASSALDALLPIAVAEMPAVADSVRALSHLTQLLQRFVVVNTTLELFAQNQPLFRQLIRVLGYGDAPARTLIAHPEWLDYILSGVGTTAARRSAMVVREEVRSFPAALSPAERLARLRALREREALLITVREIIGVLPSAEAALRTCLLAEAVLDAAVRVMARPHAAHARWPPRWCIIALGGFGAGEAHFLSDLDVLFVCECRDSEEPFLAFARDLLDAMGAVAPEGTLWLLDPRLRPDGASGPLVTNGAALLEYYATKAQAWEWLALQKARPVAGDLDWGRELLRAIHGAWPDRLAEPVRLVAELAAMRRRTMSALKLPRRAAFDLKRGPGGLWDIDFMLGAELMRRGLFLERVGNHIEQAVRVVADNGALATEEAAFILGHASMLRIVQRGLRLLNEAASDHMPAGAADRSALRRAIAAQLADRAPEFDALETSMRRMRAIYDAHMGPT